MRRSRTRRWPKIALAASIALITSLDVGIIALRDRATPVSYDRALSRFRAQSHEEVTTAPTSSPTDPTASTEPFALPDVRSTAPAPSATAPGPSAARAAPVSATDPRPAAGVYRYQTSGGEEVPFINAKRSYPAETTATVTRGRGCGWHYRADLLAEHRDEYDLCTSGGSVGVLDITITIHWFGITQSVSLVCRPAVPLIVPDLQDGRRAATCTGSDLRADMDISPQPPEDLAIGGVVVQATRVTWTMHLSGRFQGTGTWALWLEPASGLALKVQRTVDAQGATPLGRQRYVEHCNALLERLTPGT